MYVNFRLTTSIIIERLVTMFGKRNAYFMCFCIQITSKIVVTATVFRGELFIFSYVSVVYVRSIDSNNLQTR